MTAIVVDTNVFIAALLSPQGANRAVVRDCLTGSFQPLMGQALFCEYEALLSREELFGKSPSTPRERRALLAAFLYTCRWINIYYAWRPNLPDESDNQIVELAIAGGASAIVTNNRRDFLRGELLFPELRILTPQEMLKEKS